ncbi:MAG: hypothetical protein HFE73_07120 [Firmicutes bacterium]|nr:hypothetical protein [Bacillota bacterium]
MVFASAGAVFAAETSTGTDTISAVNVNAPGDEIDLAALRYNASTPDSVKIKTPKAGTIALRITPTANTYVKFYDANGQQIYGYGSSVEASTSETDYKYAYFPVTAAGTYTVQMTSASGEAGAYLDAFYYPVGGTPKKGTDFYGSSPDGKVAYYKVTASGNGYITVDIPYGYNDPATYQVKLFSSSKKALFKKGYESVGSSKDYKTRIGVGKGTYYVGVKTSDPYYAINLKFTAVKEKSGSTKAKAVKITKGTTKKGIITASQSTSSGDWYKFTLSKAQKVSIDVSTLTSQGGGSGGLKVSIWSGSKSYSFGSAEFNYYVPDDTLSPYTYGMGGKLQAGTYYIKVQKYNDGNGYYKIKWH